jgi:hypothetical protein
VLVNEAQASTAAEESAVTPAEIMRLGMAFWGSKALLGGVELGVFSVLASAGGLDSEAPRKAATQCLHVQSGCVIGPSLLPQAFRPPPSQLSSSRPAES